MRVSQKHLERIAEFIDRIEAQTYPEESSELHSQITQQMMTHLFGRYTMPAEAKVLDVGCGQGVALEIFEQQGFEPHGITLNSEDVKICRQKGFIVEQMDQSFLEYDDAIFDLIWNRHCLEHSIFPLYTLNEMHRVLKPGGYLYLEMPAPETACKHETNPNHYSVMGKTMWRELISRTGFALLEQLDLDFETGAGPDTYWAFILLKE